MTGWQFKHQYETLPAIFYSTVTLNPVVDPQILLWNEALASELHLSKEIATVAILAGNDMPAGAAQLAQSYAGHQFGHFTMLGDGRALLIGEHQVADKIVDIQLKGAGRTPYSRGGDGRAAVGPMLREYIISEAMYALGVPTTRSLAVVTTGEKIQRQTLLDGAILTRVASSHLRVGTFEFAARFAETEDVKALADFAINRHYPECFKEENPYLALLKKVIDQQASLIAKWQHVGFIHGVMNTDNMTISGETIDYGPCAFMDVFDLDTVFSSIDAHGRYAYGNQPNIAVWNLSRFAETLLSVIDEDVDRAIEQAQTLLESYSLRFHTYFLAGMRKKLGIQTVNAEDGKLIEELLRLMEQHQLDYTNTFRALSTGEQIAVLSEWQARWQSRLQGEGTDVQEAQVAMQQVNPAVIPRNYYVEQVITAAEQGDLSKVEELLDVLQSPYSLAEERAHYAYPPEQGPFRTYCGT